MLTGSLDVLLALVVSVVCGLSALALLLPLVLAMIVELERRLVVVVRFSNDLSGAFASYVERAQR
jgi:hypothetical protein